MYFACQVSGPGVPSGLDKPTDSAHTISTIHTPIASPSEQHNQPAAGQTQVMWKQ